MKAAKFIALVASGAGAYALVWLLHWAPPFLLLHVLPWTPLPIDAWFLYFALQVTLLVVIAFAVKARLASAAYVRVSVAGLKAVSWFLFAGVTFAALGAVTVISTSDAAAIGFTVADGLSALSRDFPRSGIAGGALRNFVLAPIFEEFLFRVLILGGLLRVSPPWFALAVSAFIFASFHPSWIISLISGSAFGLLYLRYRSAWLCALAHSGVNLLVATGSPLLVAHLHEIGVFAPVREHLLVLQLTWLAAALVCFGMFLRAVLGNDRRWKVLLSSSTG